MEQRTLAVGKKAIILAPDEEGVRAVFGIPAVRRLILLIQKLGVREIHLIGRVKSLQQILSDLIPPERFHPAQDPASLERVVKNLSLPAQQAVLVLKSNHVMDRGSLAQLAEAGNHSSLYFMEALGKDKTERLYCAPPSRLVPILRNLWSPASPPPVLDDAHSVQGAAGLPYILEGGEEQGKTVEGRLMEAQAAQTRESDGFLARRLSRRVSRFISRGLLLSPVTPNQVTLAGTCIGLTGAFLLSWRGYWPHLLGSLLFLLCIIVDGVDGEIARLKLKETTLGHYLDVITDNLVHVAIFAGIALGLYRDSGDPGYLYFLYVLLGGFALCGLAVYQCILRRSPADLRRSAAMIRIMALLSNRDFAYLVVLLALLQRLHWFLVGATVGTYLFAGTLWMITFYEKRAIAR